MADVWYKTGSFVTPASGTTVLGSLPGTNPKFIRLWWANNTTDNTVQAHQQFGMGFSDGIDNDCLTVTAQDGVNLNERDGRSANWCLISDPASVATDIILGSTVAMNVNDVTLSYTTTVAGRIINYEIFGGAGTTVNMLQYGSAVANSPLTHGLGTKPDLVMVMTCGQAHPASSIHSYFSFGVANDNGTTIDQWNHHSFFGDSDIDFVGSALTSDDIAGQYDSDFADWDSTITAISTTTFTWTETAAPGADQNIAAVLNFQGDGAVGVKVGTFAKSTAAAPVTQAMPDFGFTPLGYAVATANLDSLAKPATNTDRIAHRSHGAYDGTDGVVATTVGTPASNADRASIMVVGEVLQGSQALQASGVQFSGTPQAITDSTPDIEWNPNTTGVTDDVFIGFYGIENTQTGETASGAPSITAVTSSGTSEIQKQASGAVSIAKPTSSANAEIQKQASGAPSITPVTTAGTSRVFMPASGAPSIGKPTSTGVSEIQKQASGTPSITPVTSGGAAVRGHPVSGAPSLTPVTATGVAEIEKVASGTPSLSPVTASGAAERILPTSGSPSTNIITSSGSANVGQDLSAAGAPSITPIESAGVSNIERTASGAVQLTAITSAGNARNERSASGAPSINQVTSAGVVFGFNYCPPDAILAQTNVSGTITDIDERVDTPDANWLELIE